MNSPRFLLIYYAYLESRFLLTVKSNMQALQQINTRAALVSESSVGGLGSSAEDVTSSILPQPLTSL